MRNLALSQEIGSGGPFLYAKRPDVIVIFGNLFGEFAEVGVLPVHLSGQFPNYGSGNPFKIRLRKLPILFFHLGHEN